MSKVRDPIPMVASAAVEGMLQQMARLGVGPDVVTSVVVLVSTRSGAYAASFGCFCPGCEQELREALGRTVRAQREGAASGSGALH